MGGAVALACGAGRINLRRDWAARLAEEGAEGAVQFHHSFHSTKSKNTENKSFRTRSELIPEEERGAALQGLLIRDVLAKFGVNRGKARRASPAVARVKVEGSEIVEFVKQEKKTGQKGFSA